MDSLLLSSNVDEDGPAVSVTVVVCTAFSVVCPGAWVKDCCEDVEVDTPVAVTAEVIAVFLVISVPFEVRIDVLWKGVGVDASVDTLLELVEAKLLVDKDGVVVEVGFAV